MATKIKTVNLDKITFKNLPDKTTPINATNMNKIQENTQKAITESILTDDEIFNALFEEVQN